MGVSSLLFRQETTDTARPNRTISLRQMLKPWPQTTAPQPTPTEQEDAEWLSGEITSGLVRERLAQFTERQ